VGDLRNVSGGCQNRLAKCLHSLTDECSSGGECVGVVVGSSIGASPGDGSLVGGDSSCGMNDSPGSILKASLYSAARSWSSANSSPSKSMFMEGNSPVGGDIGSSVNSGIRSSNCRTFGGTVGPVGPIGATGAVLVCDAVSGNAVVDMVGMSSMGDAALGDITGTTGATGAVGATGSMVGAVGGTMGTTVGGAGGAAVMGSDG